MKSTRGLQIGRRNGVVGQAYAHGEEAVDSMDQQTLLRTAGCQQSAAILQPNLITEYHLLMNCLSGPISPYLWTLDYSRE